MIKTIFRLCMTKVSIVPKYRDGGFETHPYIFFYAYFAVKCLFFPVSWFGCASVVKCLFRGLCGQWDFGTCAGNAILI